MFCRQVSLQHASTTLENTTSEMENWLVDCSKSTVIIKRTELENVIKTVRGVGKQFNKPSESFEVLTNQPCLLALLTVGRYKKGAAKLLIINIALNIY